MSDIVMVDADREFLDGVQAVLQRSGDVEVGNVADVESLLRSLDETRPTVILVGPTVDPQSAIASLSRLTDIAVVLVVRESTTDLLRAAMRAGFSDVLSVKATFGEVAVALLDARASIVADRPEPEPGLSDIAEGGARVVTVFSTKGGVGKSVIATNLGVALARSGVHTVLLDLDLQFGDTGIMLQLKPTRTIVDAMLQYDRLDEDLLRGFLTKHQSGLEVLLAPVHPEDAESVTASRVARIIALLREIADVVVIDTPGAFTDSVLAALDKSDRVLAIATMDVASIKNTRISLQKLEQLGYDDERIRLVLNRADSKVWIEPGEIEAAVEGEIVAKIPSDRLVPRSVNKGVPVVIDAPKSAVAKSLAGLAALAASRNGEGT